MRKLILFAMVALFAIIWTVSVQSAATAQAQNAVCVPGPQCADCKYPCAKSGECDLMKTSAQAASQPSVIPAKATVAPAKSAPAKEAPATTPCGSQCPMSSCARMASNK